MGAALKPKVLFRNELKLLVLPRPFALFLFFFRFPSYQTIEYKAKGVPSARRSRREGNRDDSPLSHTDTSGLRMACVSHLSAIAAAGRSLPPLCLVQLQVGLHRPRQVQPRVLDVQPRAEEAERRRRELRGRRGGAWSDATRQFATELALREN